MDFKKINQLPVFALLVFLSYQINAQASVDEMQLFDADKQLFLKATGLIEQGELKEAETIYRDLAKRNKDWPEPKNNLAFILLKTDRMDEARQMLEQAITSSPSYRIAQSNRTQLYNYMAAQAYDKVLGSKQSVNLPEIQVIKEIQSPFKVVEKVIEKEVEVIVEKPVIIEKPVIVEKTMGEQIDPGAASQNSTQAAAISTDMASIEIENPAIYAAEAVKSVTVENSQALMDISNTIEQQLIGWSRAWSQGDFDVYIESYSDKFIPSDDRKTFAEWKNIRRGRLLYAKGVNVSFDKLRVFVEPQADFVLVEFMQYYQSTSYSDKVLKQMYMQKEQNNWRILSERTIKTF